MNQNWHNWRRQGIGSSDAPVIMGVSPWKTPHQLWNEKVFGNSEELDNPAMKRGRDLEETAREEFEKLIGTLVAPAQVVHPKMNWLRATLDGIDVTGKIMVEIKCPGKEDHQIAVHNGEIPEKYWPQLQHQLTVVGLEKMYYFTFDGTKGVAIEIKKDETYIANMLEDEKEFWDMVINKTPPELSNRDYLCMDGNEEWERYASEIIEIREQKKALEEKDEAILENLKSLSQGRSARGHGIVLKKQICMGSVDYSKVKELQGIDLAPYRKKSFEKWPIYPIKK